MLIIPYVALLAAVALIYIPRAFVVAAQAKQPEGYDNVHPRAQQAKLTGLALRAQGAHMNGFEALGPFTAGVLACEVRHVPIDRTAALSIAFVVARVVYVALYLGRASTMRTVVWAIGFGSSIGLLVLAIAGS